MSNTAKNSVVIPMRDDYVICPLCGQTHKRQVASKMLTETYDGIRISYPIDSTVCPYSGNRRYQSLEQFAGNQRRAQETLEVYKGMTVSRSRGRR